MENQTLEPSAGTVIKFVPTTEEIRKDFGLFIENDSKDILKQIKLKDGQRLIYNIFYNKDKDNIIVGVVVSNEKGILELEDICNNFTNHSN